jgi:hypothetical protein
MIILQVAIGYGWLKDTVKEINTALVFMEPATVHEQSNGIHITIHNTEGLVSGPGMPSNMLDISVKKHMSTAGVVSLA